MQQAADTERGGQVQKGDLGLPALAWEYRGQLTAVRHRALASRQALWSACCIAWAADSVFGTPHWAKVASCIHRQAALPLLVGCSSGCWHARLRSSAASWNADSRCLPQALQHVSCGSAPGPGQSGQAKALGSGMCVQKLLRLLLHGMLKAEWLAAGRREGLLLPDVSGRPPGEL